MSKTTSVPLKGLRPERWDRQLGRALMRATTKAEARGSGVQTGSSLLQAFRQGLGAERSMAQAETSLVRRSVWGEEGFYAGGTRLRQGARGSMARPGPATGTVWLEQSAHGSN